jgi:hypothetical protein
MTVNARLDALFGKANRNGPASRRPNTPAEARAAHTTRVARELTEAAADKRQATVERLRAARLEKEAAERAEAAPPVPAKAKGRKRG